MAENYYLKALSLSSHILLFAKEAKYYVKIYFRLGDITLHKFKVGKYFSINWNFCTHFFKLHYAFDPLIKNMVVNSLDMAN